MTELRTVPFHSGWPSTHEAAKCHINMVVTLAVIYLYFLPSHPANFLSYCFNCATLSSLEFLSSRIFAFVLEISNSDWTCFQNGLYGFWTLVTSPWPIPVPSTPCPFTSHLLNHPRGPAMDIQADIQSHPQLPFQAHLLHEPFDPFMVPLSGVLLLYLEGLQPFQDLSSSHSPFKAQLSSHLLLEAFLALSTLRSCSFLWIFIDILSMSLTDTSHWLYF